MIKFIHTGDIHLGLQFNRVSFDKEKAIARRYELWSTFQRIVEYAVNKEADFLIIAGDLFESEFFTLGDIKKVKEILNEASEVNILITAGNHDNLNNKSMYQKIEWSDNITIFSSNGIESKHFENLNTRVYGYSWDKVEIKESPLFHNLQLVDKSLNNILIIHGDIKQESNYLPMNLEVLKALDMDYVALGHIHKPSFITEKIAYCGSPEPLDFGETDKHGIIEGTIENGITKTCFIPFSKRNFYDINIELNENLGYLEILNKVKDVDIGNLSEDFYRIRLRGYIQKDIDIDNLTRDLEGVHYHLELINQTTPDYDLDSLEKDNKENIIGQFIKTMRGKDLENEIGRAALYYGLEALLKDR